MTARVARSAALLGALVALVAGCRDIYVCHGSARCQALAQDAGGGGLSGTESQAGAPAQNGGASAGTNGNPAGGDLGNNGEAGAVSCQLPLANCDLSRLNGCETDVTVALEHCGACDHPCDGVCARSECHLPSALTQQPIRPLSPFAVTTEYLYFMWGDEGGPYRLSRVLKTGGSPEPVADNLARLSKIAAAPDRIFLWDFAENLRSVTPAGVVTDEGFEVSAVAPQASVVYAVREGALIQRKSSSTTWQPTPGFPAAEPGAELWPVDVSDKLVVLRASGADAAAHYDVLLVDQPDVPNAQPQTLTSGSGVPVGVRASNANVYWLTHDAVDSDLFELRRRDLLSNIPDELVAKERNVLGFTVDEGFAYLPRSLSTGYELEFVLLDSVGEKYHLGSRSEITYPESVGQFLWFFDTSAQRLMRVDLGFGDLL